MGILKRAFDFDAAGIGGNQASKCQQGREKGDQFAAEYRAINPQMMVPTLIDGDIKLFQSLAILEYLDERYPEPPLLPADSVARAWARGLALINVADSHPLIVPRVRHYLTDMLKVSEEQRLAWIQHWLGAGLAAIEALLAEHPASGRFCHDDGPTVADICLVTQVTPAKTLNLSLDPYPRVMRVLTPAWPSPTLPMPTQQSSPTRNKESSGVTLESLAPSSAPETGSGRSTLPRNSLP